jgi:hypothetical protein
VHGAGGGLGGEAAVRGVVAGELEEVGFPVDVGGAGRVVVDELKRAYRLGGLLEVVEADDRVAGGSP